MIKFQVSCMERKENKDNKDEKWKVKIETKK